MPYYAVHCRSRNAFACILLPPSHLLVVALPPVAHKVHHHVLAKLLRRKEEEPRKNNSRDDSASSQRLTYQSLTASSQGTVSGCHPLDEENDVDLRVCIRVASSRILPDPTRIFQVAVRLDPDQYQPAYSRHSLCTIVQYEYSSQGRWTLLHHYKLSSSILPARLPA